MDAAVTFKINQSDLKKIDARARKANMSRSNYIRDKALADPDSVSSSTKRKIFRNMLEVGKELEYLECELRAQNLNIDTEKLKKAVSTACQF